MLDTLEIDKRGAFQWIQSEKDPPAHDIVIIRLSTMTVAAAKRWIERFAECRPAKVVLCTDGRTEDLSTLDVDAIITGEDQLNLIISDEIEPNSFGDE